MMSPDSSRLSSRMWFFPSVILLDTWPYLRLNLMSLPSVSSSLLSPLGPPEDSSLFPLQLLLLGCWPPWRSLLTPFLQFYPLSQKSFFLLGSSSSLSWWIANLCSVLTIPRAANLEISLCEEQLHEMSAGISPSTGSADSGPFLGNPRSLVFVLEQNTLSFPAGNLGDVLESSLPCTFHFMFFSKSLECVLFFNTLLYRWIFLLHMFKHITHLCPFPFLCSNFILLFPWTVPIAS